MSVIYKITLSDALVDGESLDEFCINDEDPLTIHHNIRSGDERDYRAIHCEDENEVAETILEEVFALTREGFVLISVEIDGKTTMCPTLEGMICLS